MHVHPAAPDQRRVELVDVVGGEHEDPLAAARRPQPIDEVEQAGQRDSAGAAALVRVRRHRR